MLEGAAINCVKYSKEGAVEILSVVSDTQDDAITKPDGITPFTLLTLIMPY